MPATDDATLIEAHLKGTPRDRQRRAALLAELLQAFADGGPEAVEQELTRRVDVLSDAFDDQLAELKKHL